MAGRSSFPGKVALGEAPNADRERQTPYAELHLGTLR